MADKNSRRAADSDLAAPGPDRIRNVVLVGPSGSGKTALVAALRRDRVADADQRSVSLTVTPLPHEGIKINLVDTPGYADFVGEVRAGLRAADCALFVVAANEGVDDATRELWRECDAVGMPRAVVVTKLDHARADTDTVLLGARAAFGEKVLPAYVADGQGVVSLLEAGTDDPRRAELIEAVIEESEDETLMERYVGGEAIDEKLLVDDLEKAIARATLFPLIPVCATNGSGLGELLDLCVRAFPAPAEHVPPEVFAPSGAAAPAVTCDPAGPLVAEVVKTTSDPYLGRVSVVRVFSGTLDPDSAVHVSGHFSSFGADGHEDHDEDERIGALAYPSPGQQVLASHVVAGDIAVVSKLSRAETGDTLSSPEEPRVLRPWTLPDPLLPVAIEAASRSDEDKLSPALSRLAAEDPSLRVEQNPETGQLVLWVMGEAHAEVALDRLQHRYGVAVEPCDVIIPLRECFTGTAKGHGRHVKQSGGHGQYAICDIEVEPLPGGSGFEFVDKVVGGAVPRQFIPSVEKGVRTQMERGVREGFPVVDLRVTLLDGKAHSVDSSDMAFQTAGALALKDAAEQTRISLLEPYDEVAVLVSEDLVGAVMSDLSSRRGRLLGTEQVADRTVVRAHVPQRELVRYAIDLRAMSHGAGSFSRTFAHYEPAPE
ncbi:elongation factor G-like protein EF-G2 [Nocardioides panacisoli]|uniref:Elongation factor G-like protein EF-G2 n=1 Tax=Nocardioides panacisoli TaxID=627624 RepID=A0ABP7IP97_9ACTN